MNKIIGTGEYGINIEVYEIAFDNIPKYITAMHNACLPKGSTKRDGKQPRSETTEGITHNPLYNTSLHRRISVKETVYK